MADTTEDIELSTWLEIYKIPNAGELIAAKVQSDITKAQEQLLDELESALPDTTFHGLSIRVKQNIRDNGYADGIHELRLVIKAKRKEIREMK